MTDTFTPPPYPQARTCPYDPPPGYRALPRDEPIVRVTLFDGRSAWLVPHYDDARTLLADPRLSSDRRHDGFPLLSRRFEALRRRPPSLIALDPPDHGARRRPLIADFTVRRVTGMRAEIEEIVAEFLDRMLAAGPPADLVEDFALPVPSMVICRLLGVPYADHAFFQDASHRMLRAGDDPDVALRARDELAAYLRALIEDPARRAGLLGRLAGDAADTDGLVSSAVLLLVAGHETTASMIALSVVALLDHPDQMAALRADPDLMPTAVEELLRFLSIADIAGIRVAREDIEIGGRTIRAGDGVVISNALVNRDGDVFDDPDVLDVHRSARHHLAFGYGVHQCLGQNLARMELQIALSALIRRVPTLRLAVPPDELAQRGPTTIQGVNALPITWEA
ncbi:Cytochrome P450-SU1 [Actinomadura rubteroloni]|uniref:Cytochrome P450-SU1 n=1 Tax=Actinomadura rubteroloni TaxID=1926885 RepID=A0A2P4UR43_9ACTN|nr:cytochrome P450 [Actinomadura rubteroloni]POM27494.1 Cytochrome P450-SU1 [Actinomadura rubteroloni]